MKKGTRREGMREMEEWTTDSMWAATQDVQHSFAADVLLVERVNILRVWDVKKLLVEVLREVVKIKTDANEREGERVPFTSCAEGPGLIVWCITVTK